MNQFHNLDLQNVKRLKHCSSSMFPKTCTMAFSTILKCFGKKQEILKGCIKNER
jgi:hypothetical protein